MLNYYEVAGTNERLLRVRNPWKSEQYSLENSDSGAWTTEALAAVGDDYVVADDGVFFIPIDILDSGTDSINISVVELDWQVNFVEGTDNGSTYTFTIDNPVAQDVFVLVDVLSERTTDCTSGNQVELKWVRPDYSDYDWTYAGITKGSAFLSKENLAAGTSTFSLTFMWASGFDKKDFVVRTFAADKVGLESSDSTLSTPSCYTFSDGIGNWDIKNNGASADCSKRTPENWWDASNHSPGNSDAASNTGEDTTTPADDTTTPVEEVPVEEEPVVEEEEDTSVTNGANPCIASLRDGAMTNSDLRSSAQFWYQYSYGISTCEGTQYFVVRAAGPDECYKLTFNFGISVSGAPEGDIDNCTSTGTDSW